MSRFLLILIAIATLSIGVAAQIDDICGEVGITPSFDSPFAHVPYIYGRVVLKGYDAGAKLPTITVIVGDGQQSSDRWTVSRTGNYCFKRKPNGSSIVVEVDGGEVARRSLAAFGSDQQREDFEIFPPKSQRPVPPGVVSAKFSHPKNEKTVELYLKAAEAEGEKNQPRTMEHLRAIVAIDPVDFIAWAKLGTLYLEQKKFSESDAAFRKSLEVSVDYTPAWIAVGQLRVAQKNFDGAVEIFKRAIELDATSARAYQLLGEAYFLARKGTLGADALNEAIRLDPIGMAECHAQLGHLYELAGAKKLATREYKILLTKIPNHPEKKRFEKFIKDNPE